MSKLKCFLIVSIFVTIFLSFLFIQLYDLRFYTRQFEKLQIGFDHEISGAAVINILGFFKGYNDLDQSFFNPDEISHLRDVKYLLQCIMNIYLISWFITMVLSIVYLKIYRKEIPELFLKAGIFIIAVFAVVAVLFWVLGFNFWFLKFHEIFFIDNYAFDPKVSNMKALFPDLFFYNFIVAVTVKTLMTGAVMIAFGFTIIKYKKRRNSKFSIEKNK